MLDSSKQSKMKLFSLFLVFTGIAAQDAAAEAETLVERGNLDGEAKAPRDCGGIRVTDKGNLKFSCKQKRGKGTKKGSNGKQNMGNMAVTKKCKSKCLLISRFIR